MCIRDSYIKDEFSYRLLVPHRFELKKHFSDLLLDKASIEDIMLFQIKGEVNNYERAYL